MVCGLAARTGITPPPSPAPGPEAPFAWADGTGRSLRTRRLAAIHRALSRGETRYQFTVEDPLPPLAAAGK
jgi:hypothetical protein